MEQKREGEEKDGYGYDKGINNSADYKVYDPAGTGESVSAYLQRGDSVIVGKFVGDDALAAVGTAGRS